MIKIIWGVLLALAFNLYFTSWGITSEKMNMTIKLDGKNYAVELEDNITVRDILEEMPLSLSMKRYAEHEFFAELHFRPRFTENRTSHIQAGHLYYWDGWNAFVINYEESDISPYKVVHIGIANNADDLCAYLRKAEENISVSVDKE